MSKPNIAYKEGWFSPEEDQLGPYRWMGEKAVICCHGLKAGRKHIRMLAGHSFPDHVFPRLSCFVEGLHVGEMEIESAFSFYGFSFDAPAGDMRIELKLDKTETVSGDPRALGIMVREIDIIGPDDEAVFFSGWYPKDAAPGTPAGAGMLWMKHKAVCLLDPPPRAAGKFLKLTVGHPYFNTENPTLTLSVDGRTVAETTIFPGERDYVFPLSADKRIRLELEVKKPFACSLTGDARALGIMVHNAALIAQQEEALLYTEGWYHWEYGEFFPFRWMSGQARVLIPHSLLLKSKYISGFMFSEYADFSQEMEITLDGKSLARVHLQHKWNFYSIPLRSSDDTPLKTEPEGPPQPAYVIEFSLNKLFAARYHPDDPREFGIRAARLECHHDDELHGLAQEYHRNSLLNYQEMKSGKCRLESFPLTLGIDLYGRCNINPPCVYCLWHTMKKLEGDYKDADVDETTLREYGPFFRSARTLVNCSFGEPLLHPRLEEILSFCSRSKKIIELSSNGQALTAKSVRAMVGKPLYLYISLDAACKETYAKIRNDRWDSIVPNLVLLNQERKKRDNLPKIYMVFMPMKVNRDDLEGYFQLCKRIEADALVLRPLLYLVDSKIEVTRGGYTFRYRDELLNREEQGEIFRLCDIYSEKYGVPVANQFEFGETADPQQKAGKPHLELQRS